MNTSARLKTAPRKGWKATVRSWDESAIKMNHRLSMMKAAKRHTKFLLTG